MVTMEVGEKDWASLPPELLALLFRKVQNRAGASGEGRRLLAVAAVCRAWRRSVQQEFQRRQPLDPITFPAAVRLPAPPGSSNREYLLKRSGDTFRLVRRRACGDEYFLLGARKKYTIGTSYFRISTDPRLLWSTQPGSSGNSNDHGAFGAVMKSNFWRTAFTLHDSGSGSETTLLSVKFDEVAVNGNCQRKMRCTLGPGNHAKRELAWWPSWLTSMTLKWNHDLSTQFKNPVSSCESSKYSSRGGRADSVEELRSKDPEWHEHGQCWSLEYKGSASRSVTVASIHNFQLVSGGDGGGVDDSSRGDGRVVLQLGKVCRGLFVLDFGAPLSPLEAFAISLSSFSTSVGLDA